MVAFDTETSGFDFYDEAFCVTVSWWYPDRAIESHYIELSLDNAQELVRNIFGAANTLIGHNLKFDLQKVCLAGLMTPEDAVTRWNIHDTEALAHLDNEHRPKGLKQLAVELLGIEEETVDVPYKTGEKKGQTRPVPKEKYELEQAKLWAKREYGYASVKEIGYDVLPRGVVVPYAIKDAEFTRRLFHVLFGKITRFDDLTEKYKQELQTTRMLFDSEQRGMGVDEGYVDKQLVVYRKLVLKDEKHLEKIVGKPIRTGKISDKEKHLFFNPQSNPQIAGFFEAAGFERENYDEEQLTSIDHPLAMKLGEYRGNRKTLNTYLMGLKKGTRNGVFHPSTRQHGTVSGRTSSGKETGDA